MAIRANVLLTIIFTIVIFYSVCGQSTDSTDRFKLYPLESVSIKTSFDEEVVFEHESLRSSLLILDQQVRHCFLTVRLVEYKSGRKIIEDTVFSKMAVPGNSNLRSFEDSSMIFSLYRKLKKDNQYTWGFRLPSAFQTKIVALYGSADLYTIVAIPQNYLNGKIPIGKSFPLLVITLPDANGNFPFFKEENKNKYPIVEWNNQFKLKHTFVIELLIEKNENKHLLNKTNTL